MVIINNRYEYLSILKAPGVRMQTPVVSNNNSSTTTLTRDTLVQSQQQQQQQNQQQNNNNNNSLLNNNNINLGNNENCVSINNNNNYNNNGLPGLAKAVLICRQNSHPFNNRTLFLEPHQEVKVGRSVARNRVSENNGIFDCKVLSRNHAVLWYSDGKFYIKDTGSSNGTFINNVRLSQTSTESEPYEVSSGDIVQFGVDVMENTRRETHGCIVATLKLFLPDGRETKASQSIGVGGPSTKIPPVDLYRLNQYIQEANLREQILETKLTSLQKMIEATKHNSTVGWQAMIDEDRLLCRIDMLEKKLQCFQKGMTDDKLREELLKLQDEKYQYQNSAKDALWKVHQERLDATHKLATIEKALCSSEDECSLLREQLNKTQLQLQEVTGRLDALQNQYDERVTSSEEQLKLKESEIANLGHEINIMQESLGFFAFYATEDQNQQQQQQQEYNNSAISDWLLNSDIKKMEGSEDIIKAICNDAETDASSDEKEVEDNVIQLQKDILMLERNISLVVDGVKKPENENNEPNGNASVTSSSTISTTTISNISVLNANDNHAAAADLAASGVIDNGEECDGNQNVSSVGDSQQSIPSETETTTTTTTTSNSGSQQPQQQNRSGADSRTPLLTDCEVKKIVLRRNLNHVKSDCALLLRQISKAKECNRKSDESMVAKVKYDELETELSMLKQELEGRPKSEEFEKKQQLCESLTESLASLRIETEELRALNDRCQNEMDRMEKELLKHKNIENEKFSAMVAFQELAEPIVLAESAAVGADGVAAKHISSYSKTVNIVDAETQTEVEAHAEVDEVNDNDISICSNLDELDDDEDDDEKTETIDTTEIFVGRHVSLNESGISESSSSLGVNDSVISNSHSNSNLNGSYVSVTSSELTNSSFERSKILDTIGEPNGTVAERLTCNNSLLDSNVEQELELINHPYIQREEELIAFKEKYTHLTQENIRLNQQLQKLSDDFSHFKSKSFINLLMYIAPVIVIVGYIMFNRVS